MLIRPRLETPHRHPDRYRPEYIKYLLHNYAQLAEGSQPTRSIPQKIYHKLTFGPRPPIPRIAELADLEEAVRLLPGDPNRGASERRIVVAYMRLSRMRDVVRETGIPERTCWRYFGRALELLAEMM